MTNIERLFAIEEIKVLKSRYFYYVDTQNWEQLRDDVWAPDGRAEAETPTGQFVAIGAENIVAWAKENMANLTSVHMGHMPEINILSDTTAIGRWSMEDILWVSDGKTAPQGFSYFHGFGYYHETYERGSGGWRIKTSKIERTYVDFKP